MSTMRAVGRGTKSPKRFNKLARVVALAAMMLGVGAVPSQATSITHTFSPGSEVHDYVFGSVNYVFRLGFDNVLTTFDIMITDFLTSGVTATFDSETYSCVEMAVEPVSPFEARCVEFTASSEDGLPVLGTDYDGGVGDGAINIGILYGVFGFPGVGDPIDLGQTDNFSKFMVFAKVEPKKFALGHLPTGGSEYVDISSGHCDHGDFALCGEENNFVFTAVPEPATLGGVVWGLLGLTVLSRRLKRRD